MNSVGPTDARVVQAIELMDGFAVASGLTGESRPRRYLWTDAFAVCNWLGLYRVTGDERFLSLARTTIEQVHNMLGRYRADDTRQGWISGLSETEGCQHPTLGGLRIGKPLPERPAGEPLDEMLEWERDGQYFHYLTKWMHALHCAARVCDEPRYDTWAVELAIRAEQAFSKRTESTDGGKRERAKHAPKQLVWKMSTALDRPQVDSMGHHDPLDGLIACWELRPAAGTASLLSGLRAATESLRQMCRGGRWATVDALGAGGLLFDAVRLAQLEHKMHLGEHALLTQLWSDVLQSLQHLAPRLERGEPAKYRLAFRELGLSLGLRGLDFLPAQASGSEADEYLVNAMRRYRPLGIALEQFWQSNENRSVDSWTAHADINNVMLASSLAPAGLYLV